jgi:hypothetical protein
VVAGVAALVFAQVAGAAEPPAGAKSSTGSAGAPGAAVSADAAKSDTRNAMGASSKPATASTDGCARFTWDVTRELAVMKQTPQAVTAAVKPGADVPQIQPDKLYELALSAQQGVSFATSKPGKPTLDDGAQAGLVRFRVDKPGRYRVSITSGHWIDVVDAGQFIKSRDFQGSRGCERPHKIVEYELPAGHDLTLQFSGSPDAKVIMSITAAPPSAPG